MSEIPLITVSEALEIVGGLSKPSKMPGKGWSIPADECKRGSKLRKVEGSVCHNCYACKGRYSFKSVKNALYKRLESIKNPLWIRSMSFLLKNEKYFRWFDSGDLQDISMLKKIVEVCNNTPNCKHWLPTREYAIIKKYINSGNQIPKNLTIRLSADIIGKYPAHIIEGIPFSTTSYTKDEFKDKSTIKVHNCPVSIVDSIKSCEQAKCTACWNKNIKHINYKKH